MKSYIELDVWKQSGQLVTQTYESTMQFPKEEQYGLSNQMRRCSVSIPSNIAEGHGRNHIKDSLQFFFIARGSLYELETQLYLSSDLGYFQLNVLNELLEKITTCKQMLNGLIRYFENRISSI
ncbi:four helix bundle protein [Emticicia sp.]|uniref:four helix bundle protein n=1 Tax=Emticicia sp. TaxID=1930953 RepID=UPI00375056A9